ncbi:MAG: glycosyltransferase family 4 protein [Acidobacteriota bacterium]
MKLPIAYYDVIRLTRRMRPDVIFVANYHEVILLWPLLIMLRRKVVCHMHDPPPAILFQKLSFCLWRLAIGRFICISTNVRERLSRLGNLSSRDMVLHNGVEVSGLTLPRRRSDRLCGQFGWPETVLVVGITGQMSAHKGHEDVLEAFRLLTQECANLRLVIGGKQQEPFFSHLQRRLERDGIRTLVGFAGWLSRSQDFFEAIDIFVMASRHEEGFGLVVAEAGERAVPVVCTRSGGAVEVILDGQSGILVDKNNPGEMAAAIKRLARNSQLRMEMGEAGRRIVLQHFNLDDQARELARLLADREVRVRDGRF